jgi:hypothetical protein
MYFNGVTSPYGRANARVVHNRDGMKISRSLLGCVISYRLLFWLEGEKMILRTHPATESNHYLCGELAKSLTGSSAPAANCKFDQF